MFLSDGFAFYYAFVEIGITAFLNFYIWDKLEDERKQNRNLITEIEVMTPSTRRRHENDDEESTLRRKKFYPAHSRDKRLINLGKQSHEIGVEIPYDPLFID